MLNVSQSGSNLHVVFDHAPSTFGFGLYYVYYKLRQEGPFRLKRCKPVRNETPVALEVNHGLGFRQQGALHRRKTLKGSGVQHWTLQLFFLDVDFRR